MQTKIDFIAGETRAVCRAFHSSWVERRPTHMAIISTNSIKSDFRELNLTIAHECYTNVKWEAPLDGERAVSLPKNAKSVTLKQSSTFIPHKRSAQLFTSCFLFVCFFFSCINIIAQSDSALPLSLFVVVCVCFGLYRRANRIHSAHVRGTAAIFSHFVILFFVICVDAVRPVHNHFCFSLILHAN